MITIFKNINNKMSSNKHYNPRATSVSVAIVFLTLQNRTILIYPVQVNILTLNTFQPMMDK